MSSKNQAGKNQAGKNQAGKNQAGKNQAGKNQAGKNQADSTQTDSTQDDSLSGTGANVEKKAGPHKVKPYVLAEAERDGKTVRVMTDDVRVWKSVE